MGKEQFNKDVQGIKQFLTDIYAINLETNVKMISDAEKEMFAVEFDIDKLSVICLYTNKSFDKERNATMIIKSKETFEAKNTEDLKEIESSVKELLKQVEEKYGDQIIGEIDIEDGDFLLNAKENKVTYDITMYGLYCNFRLKYSSNENLAVLTKTTIKDITDLI